MVLPSSAALVLAVTVMSLAAVSAALAITFAPVELITMSAPALVSAGKAIAVGEAKLTVRVSGPVPRAVAEATVTVPTAVTSTSSPATSAPSAAVRPAETPMSSAAVKAPVVTSRRARAPRLAPLPTVVRVRSLAASIRVSPPAISAPLTMLPLSPPPLTLLTSSVVPAPALPMRISPSRAASPNGAIAVAVSANAPPACAVVTSIEPSLVLDPAITVSPVPAIALPSWTSPPAVALIAAVAVTFARPNAVLLVPAEVPARPVRSLPAVSVAEPPEPSMSTRILVELESVVLPLTVPLRSRSSSPAVAALPPCLVNVRVPPSEVERTASVPVLAVIVALPLVEVSVSATSAAVPRVSVVPKATEPSCAARPIVPESVVADVRLVLPNAGSNASGAPAASAATSGIAAVGCPVRTTVRSPLPLSSPT